MLIILHRVFDFLCVVFVFGYLWAYCEAILHFLWLQWGAPNNGGKYTLLGSCTGGSDVCYDVTLCFLSRAFEIVCFLLV